jgi:subtilisin family serine protease
MKNFPSEVRHGSGVMMALEPARLLLALKKELSLQDLETRLAKAGFMLEDAKEEGEKKPRPVGEIVNHTETRFWVRSRSGKPVEAELAQALGKAFEGLLDWIGPVYRLANTRGRDGMLCPLPNVVVIRPAGKPNEKAEKALAKALRKYGLEANPEKSKYLGDYRYYLIPDLGKQDAYRLREVLLEKESRLVSDARFENMPMTRDDCVSPNDPLFPQEWGMTQIQAGGPGVTGWDISTGVNTVVVAVLDTGCDLTHPDITYSPLSINLGSMAPGSGGPVAGGGHGTSCAGIVAATFNNLLGVSGVAGGCVVMALARQNSTDVEVATGLNYAAATGARVVSMSFGRYAVGEGFGPTGWDFTLIDPAIANAVNVSGLVLCAATGNEDTGTVNRYPARHALVIACGASDQADNRKTTTSPDGENWWGSNFGTNVHLGVTTGVSVVAPGVLIPTIDIQGAGGFNTSAGTAGDYVMNFNGTSSATPHVAGLAGLLFSQYPALTGPQVRTIIERTAQKVGAAAYAEAAGFPNGTRNQQMGYGRINVFRALDFADVLIKDWTGDGGVEPSTPPGGNFWTFSDIVLRINDDNVFDPGDPSRSSFVERGQVNYLYVRVTNNGPRAAQNVAVTARITPYVGLEFVYPADWTLVNGTHVSPTPVVATFVTVPPGGTVTAKFTISSAQVQDLWGWVSGMNWHPCLLALVSADNDYAFATATLTGGNLIVRRNNLAQRNLTVIDVLADTSAAFPFLAGNLLNAERFLEILVDRSRLPKNMPLLLALEDDGRAFPLVDLRPVVKPAEPSEGGIVFLERTRIETKLVCCPGVLTLEKGSRFDCLVPGKIGKVSVKGGEVILREEKRFVEIRDEIAIIRAEKQPNQLYPLALQTSIPRNAQKGQQFMINVAQRNEKEETVGGATVIYFVS